MYACQSIDEATQACLNWVEFSIIPTLSNEVRDYLLITIIATYFTVLVVRTVKGLISKPN